MSGAPPLAQLPVRRALATMALDYLAQLRAAALRLDDPQDEEALHDVRVALRRLRSLLRVYGDEFEGAVTARQRKALQRLAQATNSTRDAEVQYAWLTAQGKGLRAIQRNGYDWLLAQLAPAARPPEALTQDVLKLCKRLRSQLRPVAADAKGRRCYAMVAARHAGPLRDEVLRTLAAIDGPHAEAAAHAARIAVKRLRYLLAPLHTQGTACAEVVQRLRQLQDLLGELHDRHVLIRMLADAAARCGAAQADALFARLRRGEEVRIAEWRPLQLPGLLALAVRNEAALLRFYQTLYDGYLAIPGCGVASVLAAAIEALHAVSCDGFRLS